MRTPLLVATLAAAASASQINAGEMKELWTTWKALHQKVYTQYEDVQKFSTFVENYVKVVEHNKQNDDVKLALNQFADMSHEEFQAQYLNGYNSSRGNLRVQQSHIDYSVLALPDSVDWREKGAVTPPKNQGSCGSCWAFSATGALEGLNFIKTGKLLSFSEQQLNDCDPSSQKCSGGGEMDKAFEYTAEKGIETEEDYPYVGRDTACKYDASKAHKVNVGHVRPQPKNVEALKAAIATNPVSVAVEANFIFQFYFGGVLKNGCGSGKALNHGILAVGYGNFDGKEAFIVKNSWGAGWGKKGYILISTDGQINQGAGVCGILLENDFPIA